MKNWILLDNQSTDHIFCNKKSLEDVKKGNVQLDLVSNGGTLSTTKTAQFDNFKERVWCHRKGVTNILVLQGPETLVIPSVMIGMKIVLKSHHQWERFCLRGKQKACVLLIVPTMTRLQEW